MNSPNMKNKKGNTLKLKKIIIQSFKKLLLYWEINISCNLLWIRFIQTWTKNIILVIVT